MKIFKKLSEDINRFKWLILGLIMFFLVSQFIFHRVCAVSIITGYPCPGCGTSRAFLCILKGDFYESLQYNPFAVLWILLGAWILFSRYILEKPVKWFNHVIIIIGLLIIALYIYRMIVVFPGRPPMVYYDNNVLNKVSEFIKKLTN